MIEAIERPAAAQGPPLEMTPGLYERWVSFIDASPATVRAYKTALKQFAAYLARENIRQPTRETVIQYREDLKRRCAAATVQNYVEAVRLFFAWTAQAGLYPNIADRVKGAKVSKEHKRDYLTSGQISAVLGQIDTGTQQGARDYALITLAVIGGLRVVELHRANVGDIDKAGNDTALYIQGKGRDDKADFIKIPLEVETALRVYLKSRGSPDQQQPLFTSISHNSSGRRLSSRSISGIIKRRLVSAGYNSRRLTAHSLRHSAVTISLLEGNTIQEVQQFARHRNIATTQIYAHNIDRAKNNCEATIAQSIFNKTGKENT